MNIWPLFRKEMKTYFISPIAYAVLVIYGLIAGFIHLALVGRYTVLSMQGGMYGMGSLNPSEMLAEPLFANMAVTGLFLLPMLTMRLFSDEKKTGTVELLFTYPLRDVEIVLAKLLACLAVYAAMVAIPVVNLAVMERWVNLDWAAAGAGCVGLLLLGGAFISLGICISAQTENQIVAGAVTFGALLLFWIVGWLGYYAQGMAQSIFSSLSLMDQFEPFSQGVIDTRGVVFYLSFAFFFVFLTLRTLASKRYRG